MQMDLLLTIANIQCPSDIQIDWFVHGAEVRSTRGRDRDGPKLTDLLSSNRLKKIHLLALAIHV